MRFFADLHIHSRFSRATSKGLNPEEISCWARRKGLAVVGTGDFTHPGWLAELTEKLEPAEQGLYRLGRDGAAGIEERVPGSCPGPTRFILSGEISCIYKKTGKTRKVHHVVLMTDMAAAARFNARLARIGNLASDGRPILGLDSRNLLEIVLEADPQAFLIPAHVWTPWFSVFGSKSGFDTLEECFEDLTPHIRALETGLSSDPPMNRCLSMLDDYRMVSSSDAHSAAKLGREATVFETELSYPAMVGAMKEGTGLWGTVEFFPQEGKYHYDGHRKCHVCLHPEDRVENGDRCPVCGRPLTLGVLHRVLELADRDRPRSLESFCSLIPLPEILSEILGCGSGTKRVASVYEELLGNLGPELHILLDAPLDAVSRAGGAVLAEAVRRMRQSDVICQEGYDGEYGVIRLFEDGEQEGIAGQMGLFGVSPRTGKRKSRSRAPVARRRAVGGTVKTPAAQNPSPPAADPVLDPLNREQRAVVLHSEGHLLVAAGPGTGKTLTVTHRIAHLVRSGQARPEQILALTFTRKAAGEMAHRIQALVGGPETHGVRAATFHGFCLETLRFEAGPPELRGFAICSEEDAQHLAAEAVRRAGLKKTDARGLVQALPALKLRAVLADCGNIVDPGFDAPTPERAAAFQHYQDLLRENRMLDLDDLEVESLRLLRKSPALASELARRFPWVFVDEYQDVNSVQVMLLQALVHGSGCRSVLEEREVDASSRDAAVGATVCAIGDPDQSIYGFRGSEADRFFRFAQDFPGAVQIELVRNYRSTEVILRGSAALLHRRALRWQTDGGAPFVVISRPTAAAEAEAIVEQVERLMGGTSHFSLDSGRTEAWQGEDPIGFGDIAVLYRLNAQGDPIEDALGRAGIPCSRSGERPLVQRYPVDVVRRSLQIAADPQCTYYGDGYAALCKTYGISAAPAPDSSIFSGTVAEMVGHVVAAHAFGDLSDAAADDLNRLSALARDFSGGLGEFLDRLSLERGIDHEHLPGDRVALMTLHAAKGLQWPVVFISGCEADLLPCSLFREGDEAEERRLFYVGITRARSRVVLTQSRKRTLYGRTMECEPSPFLQNIPANLCRQSNSTWKPRPSTAERQLRLF